MSVDLAQLALSVDATGFVKADKTMSEFNKTATNTEKQADKVAKSADRMNKGMGGVSATFGASTASVDKLNGSTDRMTRGLSSADTTMRTLTGSAKALAAGLSIGTIIKYADSWTGVTNVLKGVTNSQRELIKTQSNVINLSKDTYSSLEATSRLYSEITRSMGELGVSQERIIGVTRTINNLFLAGGKSAESAAGAILQLNQGFASGVLRGDEFNSVAEGAPRILDALTKSLGISRGSLRDFAATGGITAEILIKALEEYSTEAQRAADITERTFSQSAELAKTFAIEYVGASKIISGVNKTAGSSMIFVAQNLDILVAGITAYAIVITSKLLTAYALRLAASVRSVIAMQAEASGMATLSLAARGMAVSVSAGAAAMALLGGPLGVAMLAGAAIYYFATRASDAEKILEGLNPEVDGLAERFTKLGAAQKELVRIALAEDMQKKAKEVAKLSNTLKMYQAQISAVESSGGKVFEKTRIEVLELQSTLEGSQKELAKLQSQFDQVKVPDAEIQKMISSMTDLNNIMGYFITGNSVSTFSMIPSGSVEAVAKVSEEYKKLAYEIEKQIALHGDQTKSSSLAYDIQKKNLKDMTESEAILAVSMYKRLEALDASVKASDEAKKATQDQLKSEKDLAAWFDDGISMQLDAMKKAEEQAIKQQGALDTLTDSVDNFGGAWSRTGSVIVDAMGSITDSMIDYLSRIDSIAKKEKELADARVTYANNPKQIDQISKAEQKLAAERTAANVSSYRTIAGAAGQMFSKNEKARKAFHSVDMALSLVELAMSFKKSMANAVEAVTNQGKGDPYSAFFRISAMAAVMAGLGFAVSGGGGGGGMSSADRQEKQGTGTVLGSSDKSQSFAKALESYKDIAIDQLSELRGIRNALAALDSGVNRLATLSVRQGSASIGGMGSKNNSWLEPFGGDAFSKLDLLGIASKPLEQLFGKTTKKIKDQGFLFEAQKLGEVIAGNLEAFNYATIETTKKRLWGAIKKSSTGDVISGFDSAIENQITGIFSYIGQSINSAVDVLGIKSQKSINDFVVSIGKISLDGLSGDEIRAELSAVFSAQADLIAEFMLPQLSAYQKMGEGAFETLTRVAMEQAVFNDAIDTMGVSLGNLSALMRVDVAQSVIDLMGGLDQFTEATSNYVDKFFTDAEKTARLGGSLADVFNSIGVAMPSARDGFRSLVEGIDLTSDSGQSLFATLMSVSPAFDDYIASIEKVEKALLDSSYSMLAKSVAAEKSLVDAQLGIVSKSLSAASGIYSVLESSLNGLVATTAATEKATTASGQRQLESMLAIAKKGGALDSKALSGALSDASPATKFYSTFEDYATDLYKTANTIRELKDITGEQITDAERTLAQLQSQNDYLADILTWGKQQVDVLNGIDNSVLSLSLAMTEFMNATGATLPEFSSSRNMETATAPLSTYQATESLRSEISQNAQDQKQVNQEFNEFMKAAMISISDNTLQTKKILQKFDAIGTPPVRTDV